MQHQKHSSWLCNHTRYLLGKVWIRLPAQASQFWVWCGASGTHSGVVEYIRCSQLGLLQDKELQCY